MPEILSRSSILSCHCKTSAHLKRNEKKTNSDSSSHENSFIDSGKTIKVKEMNEEESDEDSLSIQEGNRRSENDNYFTEVKE